MPNNIYKFRRKKWADPKRFKLMTDFRIGWNDRAVAIINRNGAGSLE
ncbi:hypothetical protein JQ597_35335 [Bradyrhizobium sp. AUGA SZCCT0177]|nr:hypothetical protein [Bradyrhizobium sp. AUGA SZCCT0177]MBR1287340.1 hypothetical protein [Bradyrhizobium sp. AUGA SZCCT0177]